MWFFSFSFWKTSVGGVWNEVCTHGNAFKKRVSSPFFFVLLSLPFEDPIQRTRLGSAQVSHPDVATRLHAIHRETKWQWLHQGGVFFFSSQMQNKQGGMLLLFWTHPLFIPIELLCCSSCTSFTLLWQKKNKLFLLNLGKKKKKLNWFERIKIWPCLWTVNAILFEKQKKKMSPWMISHLVTPQNNITSNVNEIVLMHL